MRLKKNIVSLGSSRVSCAKGSGDEVDFYMAEGGCIVKKSYNLSSRSLKTDKQPLANAEAYLRLGQGSVQDLGEVLYVPFN